MSRLVKTLAVVAVVASIGFTNQAFAGSGSPGPFGDANTQLGDLNGDMIVDCLDVPIFIMHVQTGTFHENADINSDGAVNLLDVAGFLRLVKLCID